MKGGHRQGVQGVYINGSGGPHELVKAEGSVLAGVLACI